MIKKATFVGGVLALSFCQAMAQTYLYVATNGNDANAGTIGAPFLTLAKAVSAAAAVSPFSTQKIIYLRGGEYTNVTCYMQGYESGADCSQTTIATYPGDSQAILYGGQYLKTWTNASNGWWQAWLPAYPSSALNSTVNKMTNWEVRMLLVDGNMAVRARYPTNGSSLTYTNTSGNMQMNYNAGDIPPASLAIPTNMEVMVDQSWDAETMGVNNIDTVNRIIYFSGTGLRSDGGHQLDFTGVQTYRIYNTPDGMALPGQFYFDRLQHFVMYYPIGGKNPNTSEIVVPTTSSLFKMGYQGWYGPSNIAFNNLTLKVNAVDIENEGNNGYLWNYMSIFQPFLSYGLTFANCTMGWCGGNAVGSDYGFDTNAQVRNCEVGFCGGYGVCLREAPCLIWNNYIHDCGLISWQSPLVRISTSALVTQNNLFNATESAVGDYAIEHCIISWNSISNCMNQERDMGAYYQSNNGTGVSGMSNGNVIAFNLFQHIGNGVAQDGSSPLDFFRPAVYFDEQSSNSTCASNIFVNCPTPFFCNVATCNSVTGNVAINTNSTLGDLAAGMRFYASSDSSPPNVFYGNVGLCASNFLFDNSNYWNTVTATTWSSNVFWSTHSPPLTNGIPTNCTISNPLLGSLYPPLFFSPGSPAAALGIRPLTFAQLAEGVGPVGFGDTGSMSTARRHPTATLLPNGLVMEAGGYSTSYLLTAELYNSESGTWTNTGSMHTARTFDGATLLPNGLVLVAGGQTSSPYTTASAELYDWVSGTWTNTGSLNTPREYHTMTLLPNGLVLAAAGVNENVPVELSSAELYDWVSGTWTNTGSLGVACQSHTATLLPNGLVLVAGGGTSSGALSNSELYYPETGTWTNTGALNTARQIHTATLLPNGLVLVVGGTDSSGNALTNAEVYNPENGTWTNTGSLSVPRYYHTATLLPNGLVLVAGGENSSGVLTDAELYDPSAGTWTTTTPLTSARFDFTATLLPDGNVMAAGGRNGTNLPSAELYVFPFANTVGWTNTGSMSTARRHPTATLLPNGLVMEAGGYSTSYLLTAELYNSESGTWTNTGSMHTARTFDGATLLPNGLVLVAGGQTSSPYTTASAELYDWVSGTWTNTGSLGTPREYHTMTLLPNGLVLAAAGVNENVPVELSSAELYDWVSGTWTNTGSLGVACQSHTATLLPNGLVLVAGGGTSSGALTNAELYDPQSGTWTNTGALNTARQIHTATLLPNGLVLVVGGTDSSGNALTNAEVYNPENRTWTNTGSLSVPRYYHTATLLANGLVLVAGGENSSGVLSDAELYDPSAGAWTFARPLKTARFDFTATAMPDGNVLAAGGRNGTNLLLAELYYP